MRRTSLFFIGPRQFELRHEAMPAPQGSQLLVQTQLSAVSAGTESVNREIPFAGLHWFIDHAETVDARNIDRIGALGGGIAIQHRMAYQGEYFVERYGATTAATSPPIRQMLAAGVPLGAGTDATRVASYNPWVCLYWLVTGRTIGGLRLYDESNRLDRTAALRLWTEGSAWFSTENGKKGRLVAGQLGDVAVLSDDYFNVGDEVIKDITSVLTIVGGRIVHADGAFKIVGAPDTADSARVVASEHLRRLPRWLDRNRSANVATPGAASLRARRACRIARTLGQRGLRVLCVLIKA